MAEFIIKATLDVDQRNIQMSLKKIESATKKTADKIRKTFEKISSTFKNIFTKMVKIAKWAFAGIAAAVALSVRAFTKQQDALFRLEAALTNVGDATTTNIQQFKDFAAEVQQATKFGDELVLSLIAQQSALGVSTDKLEEAARMSIGLAAATGRNVESMNQYVALALQGEFTMLRRYIPALRQTTDATEQLQIVQEFAARGFKIAEAESRTLSGRLAQMRNAIGDVAEVIGGAFAPVIERTAIAITNWAKNNQDRIEEFAKRAAAALDSLISRVEAFGGKFAGTAGEKGLGAALAEAAKTFGNIMLETIKAIGRSLKVVLTPIFQDIGQIISDSILINLPDSLITGGTQIRKNLLVERNYYRDQLALLQAGPSTPSMAPVATDALTGQLIGAPEAFAELEKRNEQLKVQRVQVGSLTDVWKDYGRTIDKILPEGAPSAASLLRGIKPSENIIMTTKEEIALRQKIGETETQILRIKEQQAEIEGKIRGEKFLEQTQKFLKEIDNMHRASQRDKIVSLKEWGKKNDEMLRMQGDAYQLYIDKINNLEATRITRLDTLMSEYREIMSGNVDFIDDKFASFFESMESSFSNAITRMIMDGESFSDAMTAITREIARAFIQMAAEIVVRSVFAQFLGGALGMGIGAGMGAPTSATPTPAPTPSGISGPHVFHNGMSAAWVPRLHNGLRKDEFPAILQTGETVLKRGDSRADSDANVTVNVINQSSQNVTARQTTPRQQGKEMVIDVILEDAGSFGPLSQAGVINKAG